MKFGVITYPGSNCDYDMIHVLRNVMGHEVVELWHKEKTLPGFTPDDCIVLPGGFSYGDYLRSGAIARFSPIMDEVIKFGENGGKIVGICNGFQILCESGLLPGVLLKNDHQKFNCKNVYLKTCSNKSFLGENLDADLVLKIPVAHADGRFYAEENVIKELEANNQILFKYCDENGNINPESNHNGSVQSIAGICNEKGNIIGMMPHPERAAEPELGNTDGLTLLEAMVEKVVRN